MVEKIFYVSPEMAIIALNAESFIADSYRDGGDGLKFDFFDDYEY